MSSLVAAQQHEAWRAHTFEMERVGLVAMTLLYGTVVLLFSISDYFLLPELFARFLTYRAGLALFCVLAVAVMWRSRQAACPQSTQMLIQR